MEAVSFSLNGRQYQATLDGCGHQQDEPVRVTVPPSITTNPLVRLADAYTGQADNGRRLRLILLVLAGIVSGVYGLLYYRGPRGKGLPTLGQFDLNRLIRLRRRR
jgi:hypothetical protein